MSVHSEALVTQALERVDTDPLAPMQMDAYTPATQTLFAMKLLARAVILSAGVIADVIERHGEQA